MKVLFALALALVMGGCSKSDSETSSGASTPVASGSTSPDSAATKTDSTPPATPASQSTLTAPPPAKPAPADPTPIADRKPKDGEEVAVMDTSMGRVVLMFFPDKAPNHVANFKYLAGKSFYDGTKFHRIIPGFMIQGGDPNTKTADTSSWGAGGPGYQVKAEFNDVSHVPGILSMARSADPDSAGSQFFIVVKPSTFLDHQYTAFGKVVSGMDVVNKIKDVPTGDQDRPNDPPVIKSLKIQKWPVK